MFASFESAKSGAWGRRRRGATLIEVMIAAVLLLLTSLGLAHAFTSAGLSSKIAEKEAGARRSTEAMLDQLLGVPWSQFLSWNGAMQDFGPHTVVVEASAQSPRLILIECAAIDDGTAAVLARVATLRAAEG
jgi:hypothetical protein